MEPVLSIKNLVTYLQTDDGVVKAVDGVNLTLNRGEVLGLVGESGCGKTIMSLAVMGMLPADAEIRDGEVIFRGENILPLPEHRRRELRGPGMAMIFQDPLTSLNPVFSITEQLTRPLMTHQDLTPIQARGCAIEMLQKVGIPAADRRIDEYPHQFSGGQRQRIMIAGALSLRPEILICDEPTTALDVSIQAQILELLKQLQEEYRTSLLFISHNLAVVAGISHRVAVMYAGWIVEEAPTAELFDNPVHPYTKALLAAVPSIYSDSRELANLPGRPPMAGEEIKGCRLHPRCPEKIEGTCDREEPAEVVVSPGHRVRCFRA